MVRGYTTIEQSRKLAEILPLESADMLYWAGEYITHPYMEGQHKDEQIPIWSLAALLGVLPVTATLIKDGNISNPGDIKYICVCSMINIHKWFDDPVDACVEIILKLRELNLL